MPAYRLEGPEDPMDSAKADLPPSGPLPAPQKAPKPGRRGGGRGERRSPAVRSTCFRKNRVLPRAEGELAVKKLIARRQAAIFPEKSRSPTGEGELAREKAKLPREISIPG